MEFKLKVASKSKKSPKSTTQSDTKITRISASEAEVVASTKPKVEKAKKVKKARKLNLFAPLRSIVGYFKGAWFELRQVHWPNRRATWGLTGAVLIFSAFFVVLILLLDVLFRWLFEQIIT